MSRPIWEHLRRLQRLQKRLAKEVTTLDAEIGQLERELRAAGFKPRKEAVRPNAGRYNEITVADAAERVLRRRRDPMRLVEIVEAIEERGLYRTKSPSFRSTVAQSLARDERFERVERGLYRLRGR